MSNFRGGSQGKMGPRDWSGVGCGVARPAASRPVEGQLSALAAGWLLHDQHDGLLFAAACGAEENANSMPLC